MPETFITADANLAPHSGKNDDGPESNERAVKINDRSPDQDDSPAKQIKRAVYHHHVARPEEPPLEDAARTDSSCEFSSAEEYQTPMRQPASRYRSHRRTSRRSPRMDMYNELLDEIGYSLGKFAARFETGRSQHDRNQSAGRHRAEQGVTPRPLSQATGQPNRPVDHIESASRDSAERSWPSTPPMPDSSSSEVEIHSPMSKSKQSTAPHLQRSQEANHSAQLPRDRALGPHPSEEAVPKPDDSDEPEEATSRVLYVQVKLSPFGPPTVIRTGKRPKYIQKKPIWDDRYGIKWNYQINGPSEAHILNPVLQQLFAKHLGHWPVHWDEYVVLGPPFEPIVHNWDLLQKVSKQEGVDDAEKLALADLRDLLSEIQRSETAVFEALEETRRDKVISFTQLWTIFAPGSVVYATPFGHPQCFLVLGYSYQAEKTNEVDFLLDGDEEDDGKNERHFSLLCWTYDFDGDQFRRFHGRLRIPLYNGTLKIASLPCFPLQYARDAVDLRRGLLDRGRKFYEIVTKSRAEQVFTHSGTLRCAREGVWEDRHKTHDTFRLDRLRTKTEEYSGRVIADVKAFRQYGPFALKWRLDQQNAPEEWTRLECSCTKCGENVSLMRTLGIAWDGITKGADGWPELGDDQLILLPATVLGFALDKKLWVQMDVRNITHVETGLDESAFDNLVLSDDQESDNTKFLIKSLVQYHLAANARTPGGRIGGLEDFVDGKGKGLVILLHGTSGTGKTLTVECVAKMTGKPLLRISVADIGVEVARVEERLTNYFALAAAWDAVLLIDEADILLESRSLEAGSLDRNAMVSVFLKILEYYEGILLLTTNRVKSIDIAVESRISLSIHFGPMSKIDQRRLFKIFLDRLDERDIESKEDLETFGEKYFKEDFNGRDIRNMFSSALAIARAENKKLARRHLDIVREFKKSAQKTFAEQRTIARTEKGFE